MANNEQPIETTRVNEDVDLDELLPQIGGFGLYQKLLIFLIVLPACIPCSFNAFNQLFMADIPRHWCRAPDLEEYVSDPELRRNLSIPLNSDGSSFAKCSRYAVDWKEIFKNNLTIEDVIVNDTWPVEPCLDGWHYNLAEVKSSIVTEFDLVCDKDIYPTIGLAGLNLGGPFGVYTFGVINDRSGRRISFFTCLTVGIAGNLLSALSQEFWFWALSRVIVGLTIPAVYQIPFIISLELVGPNYRSLVTVLTCLSYTGGLVILAGITYCIRDWKLLCIITSAPFFFYYAYWFFLPESPRWLLARGRFKEAMQILEKLARVNKTEIPQSFQSKIKQKMSIQRTQSEEKNFREGPGLVSLFKTPNMRIKTLLISLNWFANETVYVGLSYYGPVLGADPYLSFLLSSLVEIPSYLFIWFIMDNWGRRWPLSVAMIASGILCSVTVLLPSDAVNSILILFLISKFAISSSFLIIYPFAGELFPTEIRGLGIGTAAYISGLGLVVLPFITYLGNEQLVLPLLVLGVVSVIGGVASLRLPETLHYRLPQTIEDGENFGKDWTIADCCRCVPLRPDLSTTTSYEDLDKATAVQMVTMNPTTETALITKHRKIPRLVRQASIMETPLDASGSMKLTYWF